jgi:hypothetical protein
MFEAVVLKSLVEVALMAVQNEQDETIVVEDLLAGWDPKRDNAIAEVRGGSKKKTVARL